MFNDSPKKQRIKRNAKQKGGKNTVIESAYDSSGSILVNYVLPGIRVSINIVTRLETIIPK
jgi:hypothetical protein